MKNNINIGWLIVISLLIIIVVNCISSAQYSRKSYDMNESYMREQEIRYLKDEIEEMENEFNWN